MWTSKCNLNLLKLYQCATVQQIRNARIRRNNPGLNHRIKLLKHHDEPTTNIDEDELEADFMNIGKSHGEHVKEIQKLREQVKEKIIERKYFAQPKQPNFLTWNDKEQIRYLYNKDSEEWTVERLSKGFPALPRVIRLILKSNWRPKTPDKVQKHDESVENNWKEFRNGDLELPGELSSHLSGFSSRQNISIQTNVKNAADNLPVLRSKQTNCTVFSDIIKSYYKPKANDTSSLTITSNAKPNRKPNDKETYLLEEPHNYDDNRYATLDSLKIKLQKDEESKRLLPEDEMLLRKLEDKHVRLETDGKTSDSKELELKSEKKFVQNVGSVPNSDSYPEHIVIPQKAYRKGLTYKVNDCYYDSDGSFLYRVPGMDC